MVYDAFGYLKKILKRIGQDFCEIIASLDSAYDSKRNRKMIFNEGMTPNIKENPRNRKKIKRGRKRIYDDAIFQERFKTVERAFAWEDKFKRLLIRFERISLHHFGLKLMAYTMINLRHFCCWSNIGIIHFWADFKKSGDSTCLKVVLFLKISFFVQKLRS